MDFANYRNKIPPIVGKILRQVSEKYFASLPLVKVMVPLLAV